MSEPILIIIGVILGILASVPVSLGLLLMLTRERAQPTYIDVYEYDQPDTALTVREG